MRSLEQQLAHQLKLRLVLTERFNLESPEMVAVQEHWERRGIDVGNLQEAMAMCGDK